MPMDTLLRNAVPLTRAMSTVCSRAGPKASSAATGSPRSSPGPWRSGCGYRRNADHLDTGATDQVGDHAQRSVPAGDSHHIGSFGQSRPGQIAQVRARPEPVTFDPLAVAISMRSRCLALPSPDRD